MTPEIEIIPATEEHAEAMWQIFCEVIAAGDGKPRTSAGSASPQDRVLKGVSLRLAALRPLVSIEPNDDIPRRSA